VADFDFDELDRAVTGALSAKDDAGADRRYEDDAPHGDIANAPEQKKPAPKPAPAMRRGSGRFMDVVHPSSDMRNKQAQTPRPSANRPVERTPDAPVDTPKHIDDMAFEEYGAEEAPSQPLESPFLTNAKVEKRPLGAFSRAQAEKADIEPTPAPSEMTIEEAIADHLNEEPEDPLLEAPDDPLLEAVNEPEPSSFESSRYAHALQTEVLQNEAPDESSSEPIGAASIPQQYKEKDSSAPASGAIYDTEAYHQPVSAPPAKKSSSFLMFIWIALLVILGAGAGVVFYLYVLPLF